MFSAFISLFKGPEWSRNLLAAVESPYLIESAPRDGFRGMRFDFKGMVTNIARQYNDAARLDKKKGEEQLFQKFYVDDFLYLGEELEKLEQNDEALVFYHLARKATKDNRSDPERLKAAMAHVRLLRQMRLLSSSAYAVAISDALELCWSDMGQYSFSDVKWLISPVLDSLDLEFFQRFREISTSSQHAELIFSVVGKEQFPIEELFHWGKKFQLIDCFFQLIRKVEINESSTPSKKEMFDELMQLVAVELDKPLDYPPILLVLLFEAKKISAGKQFSCLYKLTEFFDLPSINNSLIALASASELAEIESILEEQTYRLDRLDWKTFLDKFKKLSTEQQLLKPDILLEILDYFKGSSSLSSDRERSSYLDFFCWMIETEKGQAYLQQMSSDVRCKTFQRFYLQGPVSCDHKANREYCKSHRQEIIALLLEQKPELTDFRDFRSLLDPAYLFYWRHLYSEQEFVERCNRYPEPIKLEETVSLLEELPLSNINIRFGFEDVILPDRKYPDVREMMAFIADSEFLSSNSRLVEKVSGWLNILPGIQILRLLPPIGKTSLRCASASKKMNALLSAAVEHSSVRVITLMREGLFNMIVPSSEILRHMIDLMRKNPMLQILCKIDECGEGQIQAVYKKILNRNQEIVKAMECGDVKEARKIFWDPASQEFHEDDVLLQHQEVPSLQVLCARGLFAFFGGEERGLPSAISKEVKNREVLQSLIRVWR